MAAPTPAVRALERAGVAYELHTLEPDGSAEEAAGYGEAAAAALGVEPDRVLKTLVATVDGARAAGVVAIIPVAARLDLRALAAAAGGKRATMAEPASAERLTGYVVGGISPLGQKRALPTFLEEAARAHETVFVSGGRRGLEIELAPADLARTTQAQLTGLVRV